jgi:SulP family sulfate permease
MTAITDRLRSYLPVLDWGRTYNRDAFQNDMIAAVIVTIMLIPQSLAYALLAGLPPEAGLYASILPIILYAVFGTSRALAVGPVAVVSLMTAAAVGQVAEQGTAGYAVAALTLAVLSGGILLTMGLLKLGFLANFLSHPVIAGFITAVGHPDRRQPVQAHPRHRGPWPYPARNPADPEPAHARGEPDHADHRPGATGFLFWVRKGLKPFLISRGVKPKPADIAQKAGPVGAVVVTTLAVWAAGAHRTGRGHRGRGAARRCRRSRCRACRPTSSRQLFVPALLISIIGFVESISVAQTLAAKKRQRIDPDQELIGLGAANIGAGFTGGYPVTGGFARSVVNFDAGAETPAAGAFTAVGLAIAALALTPLIYFLPKATLAATIIVAVLSLVDFSILTKTWTYAKADFVAVAATILLTLGLGVEAGVSAGVILSIGLHLYKTSKPHVAEVGLVPGTQHFRNILRHEVETDPRS